VRNVDTTAATITPSGVLGSPSNASVAMNKLVADADTVAVPNTGPADRCGDAREPDCEPRGGTTPSGLPFHEPTMTATVTVEERGRASPRDRKPVLAAEPQ
jgi:hypothetical protein